MSPLTVATDNQTTPSSQEPRSSTPPRPPYSPVTPVLSTASLFRPDPTCSRANAQLPPPTESDLYRFSAVDGDSSTHQGLALSASQPFPNSTTPDWETRAHAHIAAEPPPRPISPSQNPDAIALRSALSILQIQRLQSLSDIQSLSSMKEAAAANPEAFVRDLSAGALRKQSTDGVLNIDLPVPTGQNESTTDTADEALSAGQDIPVSHPQFGKLPLPQNVVRMPAINWSKYHVVGKSLDKLHEEQRRRPSAGEPRRDSRVEDQRLAEPKPVTHVVASPYRPFVDDIEGPMVSEGVAGPSIGDSSSPTRARNFSKVGATKKV